MKKLFFTLTFLLLSACAQDKNNTDQATVPAGTINQQQQGQLPLQQQRYPYQYNYNGTNCVTGQKRFRTRDRFCDSLRNNVYNNNCAVETRYEQFRTNCTDRNWQYRR